MEREGTSLPSVHSFLFLLDPSSPLKEKKMTSKEKKNKKSVNKVEVLIASSAERTLSEDTTTEELVVGESTQSLHLGAERFVAKAPLTAPIYPTATFIFRDTEDLCNYHQSRIDGATNGRHEYGRYSNPTVDECEARFAALEHGEDAVLFPSGMGLS